MRKFSIPVALLIVALVATAFTLQTFGQRDDDPSRFLSERRAIYGFLSDSFASPPDATERLSPNGPEDVFDTGFPGDEHIRTAIAQRGWKATSGRHESLKLNPEFNAGNDEGNSGTMRATSLLDHYFSGLSSLGLKSQGDPAGSIAPTYEYASNVWSFEGRDEFAILGKVFISRTDGTAVVSVDVLERFSR